MRSMGMRRLALLIATLLFATGLNVAAAATSSVAFRVLVFTKTAGERHASIDPAVQALKTMGDENGFGVDHSEDASVFNSTNLANYSAVVFALTSGGVLNSSQQQALKEFIRAGKGFVGIHSAIETEPGWDYFTELVGARAVSKAATQPALVISPDRFHPSTADIPPQWTRTDEWYNFSKHPRGFVHVLSTVKESSYSGGTHGWDHPITWCHPFDGGRSWYTGMGHTSESYSDPTFRQHLLGGVLYAAVGTQGDCVGTIDRFYAVETLADRLHQPMSLQVTSNGDVYLVERTGKLKLLSSSSGSVTTIGTVPTHWTTYDHGLQGLALDPGFETNQRIFLFYSYRHASGELRSKLSRYTLSAGKLDHASEKVLLEYPNLDICCHEGGSIAFDSNGLLYVTTGDDSGPNDSDGFSPHDQRVGYEWNDAQRTAANTRSYQGKILRIRPEENGTYTIPAGNLLPSDGSQGLPEIYLMGVRNPFRLTIDPQTDHLYFGDVGPDAYQDVPGRGPRGYDEINKATSSGNFGWPYCIEKNRPYVQYDFVLGSSGSAFSCSAPRNESRNNTGIKDLPPAQSSLLAYPSSESSDLPAASRGCRTAAAGPLYRRSQFASTRRLPQYMDGSLLIYDWCRNWVSTAHMDEAGQVIQVNRLLQGSRFLSPIEMETGPDGSIFMLQWSEIDAGKLIRISHDATGSSQPPPVEAPPSPGTNSPPVASISAQPTSGPAPLTVELSAAGSYDPDPSDLLSYGWDFNNDGLTDSTASTVTHTFPLGIHTVYLQVADSSGVVTNASIEISSGNHRANVVLSDPPDGTVAADGAKIPYSIAVDDVEDGSTSDGTIDCSRVTLEVQLWHDHHTHPITTHSGCEGIVEVASTGHGNAADMYTIFKASYTDLGAEGLRSITGVGQKRIYPLRVQAERHTSSRGVKVVRSGDPNTGGDSVSDTQNGDWIAFSPLTLRDVVGAKMRVAAGTNGGKIEVRSGSPTGPVLGEITVPHTQGWNRYVELATSLMAAPSEATIYFVFRDNPLMANFFHPDLVSLDWIEFIKASPTELTGGSMLDGEGLATSMRSFLLQTPFDEGEVCYKLAYPAYQPRCMKDDLVATQGVLAVGGTKAVSGPSPLGSQFTPHLFRMSAGSYVTFPSSGVATVNVDVDSAQLGAALICISFAQALECKAGPLNGELTLTGRVLPGRTLVSVSLEKAYTGGGSVLVRDISVSFTPEPTRPI